MLGRTGSLAATSSVGSALQWRAEQLLGQTASHHRRPGPRRARFNGGPSNCSAKRDHRQGPLRRCRHASMEGRAIARPNQHRVTACERPHHRASMEGRAIARPNQDLAGGGEGLLVRASMEGRAIARPNEGSTLYQIFKPVLASMEGRAIARPNRSPTHRARSSLPSFNGGPSNCSAKLGLGAVVPTGIDLLQWRAEQLLGQTSRARSSLLASM